MLAFNKRHLDHVVKVLSDAAPACLAEHHS